MYEVLGNLCIFGDIHPMKCLKRFNFSILSYTSGANSRQHKARLYTFVIEIVCEFVKQISVSPKPLTW